MIVDDVVFKKVEVGVVDAEAVVFEELVVYVVEVGITEVVGINWTFESSYIFLQFNMIFQLVFKYSGELTLVAVKHKFIFSVFV